MSTILVTGYEPFGEHGTNPSARLAHDIDGASIRGATIVGRELPVVFDEALPLLIDEIEAHDPAVVLSTGLMPDREVLSVERVGINVRDVEEVPDNADRAPVDTAVDDTGPVAYFATLPIRELVDASRAAGVPARISNTAGTHLCNNILYATRHHVETNDYEIASGFVHVPFSHEQVARREDTAPSMSYEAMINGIQAMLERLTATI
jgi:pyroglutamyl-peptidase